MEKRYATIITQQMKADGLSFDEAKEVVKELQLRISRVEKFRKKK